MDLIEGLVTKVKPELNHIYSEPPFRAHGGWDLGWFCREHALHLYAVAALLHKEADICVGDYILRFPGGQSTHSIGDQNDHAWCCIGDSVPVDASITLKHLDPDVSDISLVHGDRPALCEPFELLYCIDAPDDAFLELGQRDSVLIAYNEKSRQRYDVLDLLANPFQFLHRPPPRTRTFPEIYGREVFSAITYHCYRLLTEDLRPLFQYRNPSNTVKAIIRFNANASDSIRQLLA